MHFLFTTTRYSIGDIKLSYFLGAEVVHCDWPYVIRCRVHLYRTCRFHWTPVSGANFPMVPPTLSFLSQETMDHVCGPRLCRHSSWFCRDTHLLRHTVNSQVGYCEVKINGWRWSPLFQPPKVRLNRLKSDGSYSVWSLTPVNFHCCRKQVKMDEQVRLDEDETLTALISVVSGVISSAESLGYDEHLHTLQSVEPDFLKKI